MSDFNGYYCTLFVEIPYVTEEIAKLCITEHGEEHKTTYIKQCTKVINYFLVVCVIIGVFLLKV